MNKEIKNITLNFFRSATAITVLIGFLSIQFHSFVHHHDVHIHHETENHSVDGIIIDTSSDEVQTESVDCPTCVLPKHANTISNTNDLLYSELSELVSVRIQDKHTKDLYFIGLSLRGPPIV